MVDHERKFEQRAEAYVELLKGQALHQAVRKHFQPVGLQTENL